jgi:hypothetical protein
MSLLKAIEPERLAFLYALYTQSAGDTRQGVPYEALINAQGFSEALTKRLQRELEQEGMVELTTVPPLTHVGRPIMDHAHRYRRQQTIGMTPEGVRLVEDMLATRRTASPQPSASPEHTTTI